MAKPFDPNNTNTFWGLNESGDVVLVRNGVEQINVDSAGTVEVVNDLLVSGDSEAVGTTTAPHTKTVLVPPQSMYDKVGSEPAQLITGTFSGKVFPAGGAKEAAILVQVPGSWDGATDPTLDLFWINDPGTVIAELETVGFTATYRAVAIDEVTTAGSAAAESVEYTEPDTTPGADTGVDKEIHRSTIALDLAHADQPLAAGDLVAIALTRAADTYAGDVVLLGAQFNFAVTEID